MKRARGALVLLGVCAVVLAAVLIRQDNPLSLGSATATRAGNSAMYMVGLTVENAGAADRLVGVASPGAAMAHVMGGAGDLVIPGGGTGILAMDGAHIMVRLDGDADEQGGFLPITLTFESGAELSTRAAVQTGMAMDHSLENGVIETPAPSLSMTLEREESGARLSLNVQNFTFVQKEDAAPHVPGEGHAHVYLNGLKLARLYGRDFQTGALPAGTYELRVSLNTNDHRPYIDDAGAVGATATFTVR